MRGKKAKTISSKVIYKGKIFGVRRDHVVEPGGVKATRDVVTHNGSVVLLPVLADGRILLVRQYRHAARQFLWELVAGRVDPGESAQNAARRELREETGYTAQRYRKLFDAFPTPGFVSETMAVYLAEGLKRGVARPEADERITSRLFTLAEIERWMKRGKLHDSKSIAAILYYARFIRRGGKRAGSG